MSNEDTLRTWRGGGKGSLVKYVTNTRDPLLPSVWGAVDKKEDPFAAQKGGCC
jgi:guanine nucleotide-binding protein subunit gamma